MGAGFQQVGEVWSDLMRGSGDVAAVAAWLVLPPVGAALLGWRHLRRCQAFCRYLSARGVAALRSSSGAAPPETADPPDIGVVASPDDSMVRFTCQEGVSVACAVAYQSYVDDLGWPAAAVGEAVWLTADDSVQALDLPVALGRRVLARLSRSGRSAPVVECPEDGGLRWLLLTAAGAGVVTDEVARRLAVVGAEHVGEGRPIDLPPSRFGVHLLRWITPPGTALPSLRAAIVATLHAASAVLGRVPSPPESAAGAFSWRVCSLPPGAVGRRRMRDVCRGRSSALTADDRRRACVHDHTDGSDADLPPAADLEPDNRAAEESAMDPRRGGFVPSDGRAPEDDSEQAAEQVGPGQQPDEGSGANQVQAHQEAVAMSEPARPENGERTVRWATAGVRSRTVNCPFPNGRSPPRAVRVCRSSRTSSLPLQSR